MDRRECSEAGASLAYIGKEKQRGDIAEVDWITGRGEGDDVIEVM